MPSYVKFQQVDLKSHAQFNEKWVQERIAEDPKILGLGDVILKDRERVQPKAGRLDILLQDAEDNLRYEVEIQLGSTDESHVIRTLEYWDIERKRYPQYDHVAVIIAENITSRFLNVISLFHGTIPLIAIQMSALQLNDSIGLAFTTVLDQMPRGLTDDDEAGEITDRSYWEDRGSKKTLAMTDILLDLARQCDKSLELKYNKFYIGLANNGTPNNFIIIRPKKDFLRFEPRLKYSSQTEEQLSRIGMDVMDYEKRWSRFRIRLKPGEIEKYHDVIAGIIKEAYKESQTD